MKGEKYEYHIKKNYFGYSIALDVTYTADVSIHQNGDGSVTISKTKNGEIYQFCILENSTSDNAQAVWKRIDEPSDIEVTQKWYLEPICYQVGDVDMDSSITASDSRTVLNYSAGTGELGSSAYTNVLVYLADANSDGTITAADSRLILRFASGLE